MYVTQSAWCDLPNSETPMTQARIDAQAKRINRAGNHFIAGNRTMSGLIAAMTPPPPVGTCDDLASSLAMVSGGRFPLSGAEVQMLQAAGFPVPTPAATAASPATSPAVADVAASNQAGVEYPLNTIQRTVQLLIPPACTNTPGRALDRSGAKKTTNNALWVLGGLAALGLLLGTGGER